MFETTYAQLKFAASILFAKPYLPKWREMPCFGFYVNYLRYVETIRNLEAEPS